MQIAFIHFSSEEQAAQFSPAPTVKKERFFNKMEAFSDERTRRMVFSAEKYLKKRFLSINGVKCTLNGRKTTKKTFFWGSKKEKKEWTKQEKTPELEFRRRKER